MVFRKHAPANRIDGNCRRLPEVEIPGPQIFMDWPQENDKWLFDTYIGGFYLVRGLTIRQAYYSGPLRGMYSERSTRGGLRDTHSCW